MRISLRPELEKFVEEKVRNGQYANADAVLNNAVEILKAQDEMSPDDLAALRREIDIGLEQADRGEFAEFTAEDIKRAGRAELARRRKAKR